LLLVVSMWILPWFLIIKLVQDVLQ
jgi:hypothetical protein